MTFSCRIVRRYHKSILGVALGSNFALYFLSLMENKTMLEITAFCFPGAWWDILFHIIFPSSTGFILKGCNFSGKGDGFSTLRSWPCFLIASVANTLQREIPTSFPDTTGLSWRSHYGFVAHTVELSELPHHVCKQDITWWGVGGEERNLSELWTNVSKLAAQIAGCMGYMRCASMRKQMHGRLKKQIPAEVQWNYI